MNPLLWCLVVVTFLPVVTGMVAGYFRKQQCGFIDNHLPRIQQAQLTGIAARAQAAHANSWEALTLFAPIVMITQIAGIDPVKAGITGIVFVVFRVLHALFYITDLAIMRSLMFGGALVCLIRLVVLSA